jgi:hypothetical protein
MAETAPFTSHFSHSMLFSSLHKIIMASPRTDAQGDTVPELVASLTPPLHQGDDFNWDEFIMWEEELDSPHTPQQLQEEEPINDADEADDANCDMTFTGVAIRYSIS